MDADFFDFLLKKGALNKKIRVHPPNPPNPFSHSITKPSYNKRILSEPQNKTQKHNVKAKLNSKNLVKTSPKKSKIT
jgi:hypothetical protein